jgi:hypothetical protein
LPLFYRRIHSESLTRNPVTALNSDIREVYRREIERRKGFPAYEKPKTIKIRRI